MGDVSNGYPQAPAATAFFAVDSVIEIPRVLAIDGHEGQLTQVDTMPLVGLARFRLQGRGLVWFNISQDNSGGWLNEQITQSLWTELIGKLQEPCRSAAESLLCKYAFPDCVLDEGAAIGLPLCRYIQQLNNTVEC